MRYETSQQIYQSDAMILAHTNGGGHEALQRLPLPKNARRDVTCVNSSQVRPFRRNHANAPSSSKMITYTVHNT